MSGRSSWLECCRKCSSCFCRCNPPQQEIAPPSAPSTLTQNVAPPTASSVPRPLEVTDFNYQRINLPGITEKNVGSFQRGDYKAYVDPNQREKVATGDVKVKVGKPKFITVRKIQLREEEKRKRGEPKKEAGWKFHISVNDLIPGNLEKAWNVAWQILCNYGVVEFKVVPYDTFHGHEIIQAGKQITIYAFNTFLSSPEWTKLLQEVDRALTEARVVPGPCAKRDHVLADSHYISYCNDAGENGYVYDKSHGFNRYNVTDPFGSQEYHFKSTTSRIPRYPATIAQYQTRLGVHQPSDEKHKLNSEPIDQMEEEVLLLKESAIFSAIQNGDIEQVIQFVTQGVDLNIRDSKDFTALKRAQDKWGLNSEEMGILEAVYEMRVATQLDSSSAEQPSSSSSSFSSSSSSASSFSYTSVV